MDENLKMNVDDNIIVISHVGIGRWKEIMEIVTEHGWFYGIDDYERFSKGFGEENFNILAAINKKTNKVVGSVATGFYDSIDGSPKLVTLGTYFVVDKFRGKNLGTKLFQQAINNPKYVCANFGLNAAENMSKKYATKFGYSKFLKWQGCNNIIFIDDININALESDQKVKIVNFKDANYENLIEYDTKIQGGIRRDKFLKAFLDCPTSFCKIAIDNNKNDGKVIGYGNIRIGFNNRLGLGPLYANSIKIAETILKQILESIGNLESYEFLRINPPNINKDAEEIFNKLCNGKIDSSGGICFPQFTKDAIELDTKRIFSATEFGMNVA